jgi:hypothetical protein
MPEVLSGPVSVGVASSRRSRPDNPARVASTSTLSPALIT